MLEKLDVVLILGREVKFNVKLYSLYIWIFVLREDVVLYFRNKEVMKIIDDKYFLVILYFC